MRVAWATDVHLEFVSDSHAERFCARIRAARPDAVLLGGDLAQADVLATWLAFLDARLGAPAYFVLGNHDYYGSSVAAVRDVARRSQTPTLRWLPDAGPVSLSDAVALVGHGGWGDARLGRFLEEALLLTDYVAIEDLRRAGSPPDLALRHVDPLAGWEHREALQERLQALGRDAAATLRPALWSALATHPQVIVLVHVPPFHEVSWYEGRPGPENGLPGFVCKALGDLLLEAADAHPDRRLLVLCGHTHHAADATLRPNLHARTAPATYGHPDFQVLTLPLGT